MNILKILLPLILFCSCASESFDGRFDRTELKMHFGPGPEESSVIEPTFKVIPEEKKDSSTSWWGNQ